MVMHVPVYLRSTMELIAVVRVDNYDIEMIRENGWRMRMAKSPPMPMAALSPGDAISDIYVEYITIDAMRFTAKDFVFVVNKKTDIEVFRDRVWPREKRKHRGKLRKSERRERREYIANDPRSATYFDQSNRNLIESVHKYASKKSG